KSTPLRGLIRHRESSPRIPRRHSPALRQPLRERPHSISVRGRRLSPCLHRTAEIFSYESALRRWLLRSPPAACQIPTVPPAPLHPEQSQSHHESAPPHCPAQIARPRSRPRVGAGCPQPDPESRCPAPVRARQRLPGCGHLRPVAPPERGQRRFRTLTWVWPHWNQNSFEELASPNSLLTIQTLRRTKCNSWKGTKVSSQWLVISGQ